MDSMRLTPCVVLLSLFAAVPSQAVRIPAGEDAFLDVRLLIQPQAQLREKGAPDGGWGQDFFLRRARLLVFGSATKDISFFLETDTPNFGKNGNFGDTQFVQDAFVSFKLRPELVVDTGLMIIPLTRHGTQGAVALNSLDFHAFLMKYPKDGHKIWRDTGVQLRGFSFGERLHYRLGLFGGVRGAIDRKDATGQPMLDLNPRGRPRVAGQVRYNLFDTEPDFFLPGTYLGKKRVVSFGLGANYQPLAAQHQGLVGDYVAFGGDLFVDWPLGEHHELVFQSNAINHRQVLAGPATGLGFFAEASYRYKLVGPVVAYDRFLSRTGAGDLQAFHLGFNYWINGHVANLKADLAFERDAASQKVASLGQARNRTSITVQTHLFF